MKTEDLRKLARRSGLRFSATGSPSIYIELISGHLHELESFAQLFSAIEREENAKLCEEISITCAAAIRARKET